MSKKADKKAERLAGAHAKRLDAMAAKVRTMLDAWEDLEGELCCDDLELTADGENLKAYALEKIEDAAAFLEEMAADVRNYCD